jgi:Methyl-accepting chemotaxis protein (MCP) signalling domain
MAQPERVIVLSNNVALIADAKIRQIRQVTDETQVLAINASIEAAHAGAAGRGFAVVAQAVQAVSTHINDIAGELSTELKTAVVELSELGTEIVHQIRGEHLSDLAHHMIEIVDRNLYERSCDVRWWATDAAVAPHSKCRRLTRQPLPSAGSASSSAATPSISTYGLPTEPGAFLPTAVQRVIRPL